MYGRRKPVVYVGVVIFFVNFLLYWNGSYHEFYLNHIDVEPPRRDDLINFPYPPGIHWRQKFNEGRFVDVLSPYYRGRYSKEEMPECYRNISEEERAKDHPYTIVTALSENHFCTFYANLGIYHERLAFIPKSEHPRLIVYILKKMPEVLETAMQEMVESGRITEVRHFDYSKYPSFWRMRGGTRGQYAWKGGILEETMLDFPGVTIWLDAGDRIEPSFFETISQYVRCKGFFTVRTGMSMNKWVHRGFFDYIRDNASEYDSKPNCGGAAFGFDTYNPRVMEELFIPYRHCAQIQECIAPAGSSRQNHRQDQAVLTYYVHKNGYGCSTKPAGFGLVLHGETSRCQVKLFNGTSIRIRDQRLKKGAGIDILDPDDESDPMWSEPSNDGGEGLELPYQQKEIGEKLTANAWPTGGDIDDDEVADDVLREDNEEEDAEMYSDDQLFNEAFDGRDTTIDDSALKDAENLDAGAPDHSIGAEEQMPSETGDLDMLEETILKREMSKRGSRIN